MRIAYVTLDDVNRFVVQRWAGRGRFQLDGPAANQPHARLDAAGAVILDLDHLPAPFRAAWLARILNDALAGRALVHGYNIADADAAALRRRGVRVCRGRLRRGFFFAWLGELRRTDRSVKV